MIPTYLLKTTEQLQKLSVKQTEQLFNQAAREGCLTEFGDYYWTTLRAAPEPSTDDQALLMQLERLKRRVGRKIPKSSLNLKCKYVSFYNAIEDCIHSMVVLQGCTRRSKPYKVPSTKVDEGAKSARRVTDNK